MSVFVMEIVTFVSLSWASLTWSGESRTTFSEEVDAEQAAATAAEARMEKTNFMLSFKTSVGRTKSKVKTGIGRLPAEHLIRNE